MFITERTINGVIAQSGSAAHLVFLITSIIITHHNEDHVDKGQICALSTSPSNPVPHEKQPLQAIDKM